MDGRPGHDTHHLIALVSSRPHNAEIEQDEEVNPEPEGTGASEASDGEVEFVGTRAGV